MVKVFVWQYDSARCFIHTLQRAINESLKVQTEVTAMIAAGRRLVTHFNHSGKSLQNKWKKIRTSYSREVKRRAGIKSGSAASYVYFEQLHFLRPTVVINETQNSMDETRTAETNANSGSTQGERPVCKKKKTSDDDNLVQGHRPPDHDHKHRSVNNIAKVKAPEYGPETTSSGQYRYRHTRIIDQKPLPLRPPWVFYGCSRQERQYCALSPMPDHATDMSQGYELLEFTTQDNLN
ncbi:hypothetical protein EVAR_96996_1 [Eumeta japonica]|uniref:MADF domain-containing protein n=1 Tax=Eumeta variegata TaxID=151549 RepID=A0A4C1SQ59_EUMVA|nr:hypothetical protein EVAR_96996_1 [Eumeta japonica]